MALLSGAHAAPTAGVPDLPAYRVGGFGAVKLMHFHTKQDADAIRSMLPGVAFLQRLPETKDFKNNLDLCVDAWERVIVPAVADGRVAFQVDNEPQYYGVDKWWWRWAVEYCITKIRQRLPHLTFMLGLTPLSFAPGLWHGPNDVAAWAPLLTWRDLNNPQHRSLVQLCQFAVANCYWQTENQLVDPSFGHNFVLVHGWTLGAPGDAVTSAGVLANGKVIGGLPVVLGEYGNSECDIKPTPPPQAQILQRMEVQYPRYLKLVATYPYVTQAHVFIMPGAGWGGFTPSDRVLRALGLL